MYCRLVQFQQGPRAAGFSNAGVGPKSAYEVRKERVAGGNRVDPSQTPLLDQAVLQRPFHPLDSRLGLAGVRTQDLDVQLEQRTFELGDALATLRVLGRLARYFEVIRRPLPGRMEAVQVGAIRRLLRLHLRQRLGQPLVLDDRAGSMVRTLSNTGNRGSVPMWQSAKRPSG
jgi:hypothetical protein